MLSSATLYHATAVKAAIAIHVPWSLGICAPVVPFGDPIVAIADVSCGGEWEDERW